MMDIDKPKVIIADEVNQYWHIVRRTITRYKIGETMHTFKYFFKSTQAINEITSQIQNLVKKLKPVIEDMITGETTALTDVLSREDSTLIEKYVG